MIKVTYLTNYLPQYRMGLYNILFSNLDFEFNVYCQDLKTNEGYKSISYLYPNNVKIIRFVNFFNGMFSWQFLPWIKIFKDSDILIVDSNPRIVTHFLIASLFRILGKKVVLYSMLHSHENNRFNKKLRIGWMRMFKYHLLYNDSEIIELEKMGFETKKW